AGPDPDTVIEAAVGRAEPVNIKDTSQAQNRERIFREELRRLVYEQYGPAFREITQLLEAHGLRRPELEGIGSENETNRFLNWVRKTYVKGDETYRAAPERSQQERKPEILRLGTEWAATNDSKVPEDYITWLRRVEKAFGSIEAIESASQEDVTDGLMSIHAFNRQSQYVRGGGANLAAAFWDANERDLQKVKNTLIYLLHGSGDFVDRLHDILYYPGKKLRYFGPFCALELYGTIKPNECPPVNGRMAKALRYLGFPISKT
ncbi:MAG: hypothetical protein ACLFWF_11885, partial [Alphaproteobacteria bacterium]